MIPSNNNPLGYRYFEEGGFPDHYSGNIFKTDFRVWLRRNAVCDSGANIESKARLLIELCYQEINTTDVSVLMNGINWFACCGETDRINELKLSKRLLEDIEIQNNSSRDKVFDYFWDFKELWATFKAAFNIDLYNAQLHWWGFSALLKSIPTESPIGQLVKLRSDGLNCKGRKISRAEGINIKLAALPDEEDQ
jgi:hypothetical protein